MEVEARKPKILAIDDYEANLTALQAVLGRDYELVFASSGLEALSILTDRKDISVILLDVQMPDMDGFETATRIKLTPGCEDIPIIFITAVYKDDPFIKKGYDAGAVDYFGKPFNPEILKMKVGIYSAFRHKAEFLKQREKQIRETEELLRVGRKLSATLESLPVGVLIVDVAGRICQINEQVSQICSTEPINSDEYGQMLGWWDAAGKMLLDSNTPLNLALSEGKTSHNHSVKIKCKGGVSKSVSASASPLLGLDGRIVGAVVVLQDVTESRKIEEALEEQITKLVSSGYKLEESLKH